MPGTGLLLAAGAGLTTAAILSRKRAADAAWFAAGNELPPPAADKASTASSIIALNRLGNAQWLVDDGRFVRGLDMNRVTSAGVVTPHWGVDVAADIGTPVRAPKVGRVVFAGPQEGYGNAVHIAHSDIGQSTVYAHLNSFNVRVNDAVAPGSILGYVGRSCTGPSGQPPAWCSSMGPHLHFEVHPTATPRFGSARRLDPLPWLAQKEVLLSGGRALGDFTIPVSFPQVVTAALVVGALASLLYFLPRTT